MKGVRKSRLFRADVLFLVLMTASMISSIPARADDDDEEGSWSDRIGDSVKKTFSGIGKSVGLGNKPDAPPPIESPSGCPPITVLDGTTSSRVTTAGTSGNQGVRYQYSLGNVGRQCTIAGSRVAIRVGADGRVLLGPAGAPGRFDVPIRVVVFSERQQKPLTSKLYRVPASIAVGQTGTPFQFASDEIVVPNAGYATQEYSIKIGIDAGKGGDASEPKKSHRRRQKPVASASQ